MFLQKQLSKICSIFYPQRHGGNIRDNMGPGRVEEGYHGNEVGGEAVGRQQRGVVPLATFQVRHQVFERFDLRHAL